MGDPNQQEYIVPKSKLIGTKLENAGEVKVKSDGVYINGERSAEQILVYVGKKIVGYLVSGVFHYITGYTGEQLTMAALNAITNFMFAHPGIALVAITLIAFTAAYVYSYQTSNGMVCIYQSSTTYACSYSI